MPSASQIPLITVRDLRVDYGAFVAVDDLTLSVQAGDVMGLVGPNGAGKTSTFRVLATLMEPTYGEVRVGGFDVLEQPERARRLLGYMPDLAPVPSDLKVGEMLDFYARCYGLHTAAERKERVDECLALTHMEEKRTAWCKALSRGQTQRAILAKTLLHRPKALILDEPASGLDPLSRRHLRQIVKELAARGNAIIVSSHILAELAEMCPSLCVMAKGKLLAIGPVDHVRRILGQSERSLVISALGDPERLVSWLSSDGTALGAMEVRAVGNEVHCLFTGDHEAQADLLTQMIGAGFRLAGFHERKSSFEDILVDIAQGTHPTSSPSTPLPTSTPQS